MNSSTARTFTRFWKHRKQIDALVASADQPNFTSHRYIRLMIFASVDVALSLPFNIAVLLLNTVGRQWYPYKGLTDLHYDFSRVGQYLAFQWAATPYAASVVFMTPGTAIASSFIFFGFFGIGREARFHYIRLISEICKLLRLPVPSRLKQLDTLTPVRTVMR